MSDATELAREFARQVEATTEATRRGDSPGAHQGSKRVVTVGRRILEQFGDDGAEALVALLTHDRRDVRIEAASQLLGHRTEAAVGLLEKEAAEGDFLAQMALKNWRSGNWNVGPPAKRTKP